MKAKIEYIKVDMTSSEIVKAMIDGEAFCNESGTVRFYWDGNSFLANEKKIFSFYHEFFKRVETPTDKWDDANDYVRNIYNSNVIFEQGGNLVVDARMTKEQWLDFAHILLESE